MQYIFYICKFIVHKKGIVQPSTCQLASRNLVKGSQLLARMGPVRGSLPCIAARIDCIIHVHCICSNLLRTMVLIHLWTKAYIILFGLRELSVLQKDMRTIEVYAYKRKLQWYIFVRCNVITINLQHKLYLVNKTYNCLWIVKVMVMGTL